ncbi:MAG: hypothetical protein GYB31_07370 [Bacteroidetes bacterium]|nr:hypothetical protein [Bacteroidota bacterium]
MLRYTTLLGLILPFVVSAQDHCPCLDRMNAEPPAFDMTSSLDHSFILEESPQQPQQVSFPLMPEPESPQQQEIEEEPFEDFPEATTAVRGKTTTVIHSKKYLRKRARNARKGMKGKRKMMRFRGQCPAF